MFTVYPSNRLEDLVFLLEKVLDNRQGGIFSSDIILVESQGMQHWINLQLANSQGIAMNIEYPMPSRFIWDLARRILGDDLIPRKSPYSREILAFRIDRIISDPDFIQDEIVESVNRYWGASPANAKKDFLKRFQLASKLADVFEQYMLYRPEWLTAWQQNQNLSEMTSGIHSDTAAWQGKIWRLLVQEQPFHQAKLQDMAIEQLSQHQDRLPDQIFIFGINALPPKSLSFFQAIAEYIPIHLFHLNPCVEFWGDIQTDKALAKQLRQQKLDNWLTEGTQANNPLLANLGTQGRAFFNSLQQINSFEISGYSDVAAMHQGENEVAKQGTLLHQIQQDILTLRDARLTPRLLVDDSIYLTSCHSALREIQTLHDFLLHQFNQDPSLKPQDIVVMCPAIEDYAPYIEAVFRSPREIQPSGESPRLPCSIADRNALDAEPLINSFYELLQLPDSRFEISKILDYIRLPALQNKFGFSDTELETIEWWLSEAAIHWGLNADHKAQIVGLVQTSPTFTWQWGLERLLYGFAWGDKVHLANQQLWLPHVEGQNAVLLGRLCLLLERLSFHSKTLLNMRTPSQWHLYLHELKAQFFAEQEDEENASHIIDAAINSLVERAELAHFENTMDLATVRYYLNQHFSQPDSSNHFLTGQITFCSMVPMRSIPFKIIAILGLNDGQYPRQQIPISFDLMADAPYQLGDRSRRADDRYLFLEALISARDKLYLSYQGRDIRNNNERQPSLLLKELMNYLQLAYQWSFNAENESNQAENSKTSQLTQQPLHPFSADVYQTQFPSFDQNWCRLTRPQTERNNLIELSLPDDLANNTESKASTNKTVSLDDLVRFFDNPLAVFAKQRLRLDLTDRSQLIEDVEPFSVDGLQSYLLRNAFAEFGIKQPVLSHSELQSSMDLDNLYQQFTLSGHLPESPLQAQVLLESQQTAELLINAINTQANLEPELVEVDIGAFTLTVELNLAQQREGDLICYRHIDWRPATRKAKDDVRLWLGYLMACAAKQHKVTSLGIFLNKDKTQLAQVEISAGFSSEQARHELSQLVEAWQLGITQVKLYHAELAKACLNKIANSEIDTLLADSKQINQWHKMVTEQLPSDAYFNWFYPNGVHYDVKAQAELLNLYQPLYQALREVK